MGSFFGAPAMLWWGLAASVPILIHLFSRQRYQRLPWAAMEFLRRAFKKTRKRVRLEHLLILLLRILALLLLALALAAPLRDVTSLLGGGRRELVLVLDDSFSMALEESDGSTPFARAKAKAVALVNDLRGDRGDTVSVLLAGRPVRMLRKASTELDKTATELAKLEVSDLATDLSGALSTAAGLLESLPEGAEVVLLSDVQKTAFGDSTSEAVARDLALAARAITARKGTLRFVLPRATNTDNLALTALECREHSVIAGRAARMVATLTNFSDKPQSGTVRFHADGATEPFESREVESLRPGASESVDARVVFNAAGSHVVEARFATDALGPDNRRALALDVRSSIRVRLVDGEPAAEPGEAESFFMVASLDPGIEGVRSPFEVQVLDEGRFEQTPLKDIEIVVLMNTAALSPRKAEELRAFVSAGGALWVLPGDRSAPELLNTLLFQAGHGPLTAAIAGPVVAAPESTSFRLSAPDPMPTELAYFADKDVASWLGRAPIHKHWKLELATDTAAPAPATNLSDVVNTARVLLTLAAQDGSGTPQPALVVKRFGAGRAAICAFSGDQEWTDLPAFPTFVLLTRELAWWLSEQASSSDNLLAGASWRHRVRGPVKEALLAYDGGATAVLRPQSSDSVATLVSDALLRARLWRADFIPRDGEALEESTPRWVAVNVDCAESDLHRADEAWLRTVFGPETQFESEGREAQQGNEAAAAENAWWWLLLGALTALLAETALSQWFGARSEARA